MSFGFEVWGEGIMANEIIINVTSQETRVALLEEKVLAEEGQPCVHTEPASSS